jgi:hypothetical protein
MTGLIVANRLTSGCRWGIEGRRRKHDKRPGLIPFCTSVIFAAVVAVARTSVGRNNVCDSQCVVVHPKDGRCRLQPQLYANLCPKSTQFTCPLPKLFRDVADQALARVGHAGGFHLCRLDADAARGRFGRMLEPNFLRSMLALMNRSDRKSVARHDTCWHRFVCSPRPPSLSSLKAALSNA